SRRAAALPARGRRGGNWPVRRGPAPASAAPSCNARPTGRSGRPGARGGVARPENAGAAGTFLHTSERRASSSLVLGPFAEGGKPTIRKIIPWRTCGKANASPAHGPRGLFLRVRRVRKIVGLTRITP